MRKMSKTGNGNGKRTIAKTQVLPWRWLVIYFVLNARKFFLIFVLTSFSSFSDSLFMYSKIKSKVEVTIFSKF